MVLDIGLSVGSAERDMPVFLMCSIDQRADQSHAQNTMLRARVQSTASRPWTTNTAV
jgi:hypothetical protein